MTPITEILVESDLVAALKQSNEQPVLIFKYSPTCIISRYAEKEYENFAKSNPQVTLYKVNVVQQRPLSQSLAATTNVQHQSPQALLIKNESCMWNDSHNQINLQSLKKATE